MYMRERPEEKRHTTVDGSESEIYDSHILSCCYLPIGYNGNYMSLPFTLTLLRFY